MKIEVHGNKVIADGKEYKYTQDNVVDVVEELYSETETEKLTVEVYPGVPESVYLKLRRDLLVPHEIGVILRIYDTECRFLNIRCMDIEPVVELIRDRDKQPDFIVIRAVGTRGLSPFALQYIIALLQERYAIQSGEMVC